MHAIIQYSLDLWEERNNHFHGPTPKSQTYLRRQRALSRAQVKFDEGPTTVLTSQHRLFHNFDRRMEGRTRAIEFWIELVEVAQSQRKAELEALATQPDLFQFQFSQTVTPDGNQQVRRNNISETGAITRAAKRSQNRVQQNLRQMFLRTQPNVKRRN